MDRALKQIITESTPAFNPLIASGIVTHQMRGADSYVDDVWRCAAADWPESVQYLGLVRCTPEEQYNFAASKRHGKHQFEMARSDVFLVKCRIKYNDRIMEPHLYIPAPEKGGTIHLRGPCHTILPVLADMALSVTKNGVYMPFSRTKLTYERLSHSFFANGISASAYVVWSAIHAYALKESGKNGVYTTLSHYLFCKHGVKETFRLYAKANDGSGAPCHIHLVGPETAVGEFPEKDWVVCTSNGIAPKAVRGKNARRYYTPSKVKLVVPRTHWNDLTANLVAGFFYMVDNYPDRLSVEYCDEVRVWRTLLGLIIFRDDQREGKVYENVMVHMDSLDAYVDTIVKKNLAEVGIYVETTYEFFAYIIEYISEWIMSSNLASMYGKRLVTLRYVLSDIVESIFKFTFRIKNDNRRQLNERRLALALSKFIKPELIFRLSRGHGEVSVVSSPGDNTMFRFHGALVLQSSATGRGPKSKPAIGDQSKLLHSSIAEIASYPNLPKADPSGRERLNPCAHVQEDGRVLRNPEHQPVLDKIQRLIERD